MTHTTNSGSVFESGADALRKIYIEVFGSSSSGHSTLGRLNQTVNLTAYNYIKVNISSGRIIGDYIGISTNASLANTSFVTSVYFESIGTQIINISSIVGSYYIYFYHKASSSTANTNSSMGIAGIYLDNN